MDKYIGNKKSILEGIESFLNDKKIQNGLIIDAFSGTTNVGQYFKQRGFSIVCNDINDFSYILGKVYIENNSFPSFEKALEHIHTEGFVPTTEYQERSLQYIRRKIEAEKIFSEGYFENTNFEENIIPTLEILEYLNSLKIDELTEEELLFWNYYTVHGKKSGFKSTRNTKGKRNYFTSDNAKKIGKILVTIKTWYKEDLISEMEYYILICSLIEEVVLNANVNGTFHDFNRNKLYPNALIPFSMKPLMFNIYRGKKADYCILKEDSNLLYKSEKFNEVLKMYNTSVLYIDPPYNFRQYSAYYHMLNFIAIYHLISDPVQYANEFKFVRGQNMKSNFNSQYCYKEKFVTAMEDLITKIKAKHTVISYYDENNHWNNGKKVISLEGRKALIDIFKRIKDIKYFDEEPYVIPRINYQSRSGEHKKQIEELLFYARR